MGAPVIPAGRAHWGSCIHRRKPCQTASCCEHIEGHAIICIFRPTACERLSLHKPHTRHAGKTSPVLHSQFKRAAVLRRAAAAARGLQQQQRSSSSMTLCSRQQAALHASAFCWVARWHRQPGGRCTQLGAAAGHESMAFRHPMTYTTIQAPVCTRQGHCEGRSGWQHTAQRCTPGRGRASTVKTPTPARRIYDSHGAKCQQTVRVL